MKDTTSEAAGSNRTRPFPSSLTGTFVASAAMILAAFALLWVIHSYGTTLIAPPPLALESMAAVKTTRTEIFLHVLLALASVIVTGLILAKCFAYLGQLPMTGEMVAGIVLGPSFLGVELSAFVLPPNIAPFLAVIAPLGVLLYMFSVGLELHSGPLRRRPHATMAASHASILLRRAWHDIGVGPIPAALDERYFLCQLCFVHGRGHVDRFIPVDSACSPVITSRTPPISISR